MKADVCVAIRCRSAHRRPPPLRLNYRCQHSESMVFFCGLMCSRNPSVSRMSAEQSPMMHLTSASSLPSLEMWDLLPDALFANLSRGFVDRGHDLD